VGGLIDDVLVACIKPKFAIAECTFINRQSVFDFAARFVYHYSVAILL